MKILDFFKQLRGIQLVYILCGINVCHAPASTLSTHCGQSLWFWNVELQRQCGPRDGMALAPQHLCLLNV